MRYEIEVKDFVTHQNNYKMTRYGAYLTDKYVLFLLECRKQLRAHINLIQHKQDIPLNMCINVIYPTPKSWTKKKKQEHHLKYKTSTPDIDNLCKTILDICGKISFKKKIKGIDYSRKEDGLLYHDDSQIVELKATKSYDMNAKNIKIIIRLQSLKDIEFKE